MRVRYEHKTEERTFSPAKTVFKVLQWAVGKQGFNLDPMSAAKANLILPGAEQPLPARRARQVTSSRANCTLVVDLTLKDFTNG